MKLLTALVPIIALSSCAAAQQPDERRIPAQFHGEWNSRPADCGTPDNDSMLVIGADEMQFYESSGRVRGAFLSGPREVLIVAEVTGEEETGLETYRFTVAADGRTLTQTSETEEPFVRHRCPAS